MEHMKNIIPVLNLTKICRVCLEECGDMFSIYSELFEDDSEEEMPRIYEILVSVSRIKVQSEDGFPTMICTKCIDKAHSSYKFQKLCNTSQSLLEAYLERLKDLEPGDLTNIEVDINLNNEIIKPKPETSLDTFNKEILPPELDILSTEDLIKNEPLPDSSDCESLKNCLPLGEETIDHLMNDNLQDIDLMSPKLCSFNLDFKCSEDETDFEFNVPQKPCDEPKPNMHYYLRRRNNDIQEYECNICKKGFRFANSLRLHLKSHNEQKPYLCTECRKLFKVYSSLMHHVRSHSGEQPFECKVCGKKYRQSGTLTAHMRIHTGSKPFLCSICGRGFRQHPDLTYHMRTHTKEKPYMCNICGKRMSMQCHLVQHMRSHTGEKPFKCPDCDKAFPSSTRLKRHSITHTSLKPFKCNICDKSFNRKSSLRVHTKIHSGVRSHLCSVCNKGFMWAHSLRAHAATHKKDVKETRQPEEKKTKAPETSPEVKNGQLSQIKSTSITDPPLIELKKVTKNKTVTFSCGSGNMQGVYTVSPDNNKDDNIMKFTLITTVESERGKLPAIIM